MRTVGVPTVDPSLHPPLVTEMVPTSGPAATELRFTGQHLRGRRADVTIAGMSVLAGAPLAGDAFTVRLPADLPPGVHQVRLDVSGLFRRVFLFEVP